MVLVDGAGVQYHNGEEGTNESKSHARIVRSGQRGGYHFWASDATQGYRILNPDVRSVTRTVVTFPEVPAIVVLDKVIKENELSSISTRWHLENSDGLAGLALGDSSFTIVRPRARLFTRVEGSSGLSIAEGTFESERKEHPFTFAEVSSTDSLKQAFLVTVGVPLTREEPDPEVAIVDESDHWTIRIQTPDDRIELRAFDAGVLPEFEVLAIE
jgi:hypothetical protein